MNISPKLSYLVVVVCGGGGIQRFWDELCYRSGYCFIHHKIFLCIKILFKDASFHAFVELLVYKALKR